MFISHGQGVQYYVGDYTEGVFTPEKHERMNQYGGQFFANETLVDADNRTILWGWVVDARTHDKMIEEQYSGVISLPRELVLGEDGYIRVTPVKELQQLRTNEVQLEDQLLTGEIAFSEVQGRQLELEFRLSSDEAAQAGIKLCCSPDGQEETSIL